MPKTVPCQVRSSGGRRSWSLMAALSRIANKVLPSTFPGLKIFFDFMASFSFTVQKFFVLSEIRIPLPVCCSFRNKKRADKSGLPAKIWGGEWKGKQGTRKKPREISLRAREQS